MSHLKSIVWQYFTRSNDDKANCKKCNKSVSCKGGSTSSLLSHLKSQHNLDPKTTENESVDLNRPGPSIKCSQPSILQFTKRISLEEIVSRLAAEDGLSIRQITKSSFIRESISSRGYELPKSENSVMKIILNYAKKIENAMKDKIKENKMNKYSITFDEWSSLRGRRYMNLNLHCSIVKLFNLGLIRIHGRCDSLKTKEMIDIRLQKFDLTIKHDIVGIGCDGAAVNIKYGEESEAELILCLNHGIHLGVLDVLYKKNFTVAESVSETNDDDDGEFDEFSDNEDDEGEEFFFEYSNVSVNLCISSLRNVVKFFKRSPVRNSVLQQHVKDMFKHEMVLILDCKTRWNSLLNMIDRYLKIKDCVKKALDDLHNLELIENVSDNFLSDLRDALNPVQVAVEALTRKDATIVTAETIILFMLNKIDQLNTDISRDLLAALKKRVLERRNIYLTSLVKYLKDAKLKSAMQSPTTLPYVSKAEMLNYGKKLMDRLFLTETTSETGMEGCSNDDVVLNTENENNEGMSLGDELTLAIAKETSELKSSATLVSLNTFKKECQLFEASGQRPKNLEQLYNAILSIKPTSTDAERTFSISGNFCNKIRSRLGDESLSALVFLKFYFLSEKSK